MNKDELMKLEGVTSEIADAVLKAYEGYVPHDRFNEVNEAKKTAEAAVVERDKQIALLKKDPDATEGSPLPAILFQADIPLRLLRYGVAWLSLIEKKNSLEMA